MEIRKIAVGVDFSPESEVALRRAIDVARRVGAEIVLVHAGVVHEPIIEDQSFHSPTQLEAYQELLAQTLRDDRQRVEELRSRYSGQGVELSHVVVNGFADNAVVNAAVEMKADMVAVGTHGRTGLRRFLLGSIAERVVRLAPIPVLVARGGGRTGFHRILVPTDFSTSSERALDMAIELAAADASIDVLYCWNLPALTDAYSMPAGIRDAAVGPMIETMEKEARQRGDALMARYRDRWPGLTFNVARGAPAHAIVEWANGYDLIITGSHGRRGFRRFLLGSVAESTVRHAPCSVIVVHGPDTDEG